MIDTRPRDLILDFKKAVLLEKQKEELQRTSFQGNAMQNVFIDE